MTCRFAPLLFIILLISFVSPLQAFKSGYIDIKGNPADKALHFFVDGVEFVSEPPWPIDIGNHLYKISRPGFHSLSGEFSVSENQTTVIDYELAEKFSSSSSYFYKIPEEIQQRGRWLTISPVLFGWLYPHSYSSELESQFDSNGQLVTSFLALSIYSPKPYMPLMLGVIPIQLNWQVNGSGRTDNSKRGQLSSIRSKIYLGAYWCGYHMLLAGGLQGWLGGQIHPTYSITGGGGFFTQIGLFLNKYFNLDLRYDLDFAKRPGHTLQIEWQVNIFGHQRR